MGTTHVFHRSHRIYTYEGGVSKGHNRWEKLHLVTKRHASLVTQLTTNLIYNPNCLYGRCLDPYGRMRSSVEGRLLVYWRRFTTLSLDRIFLEINVAVS